MRIRFTKVDGDRHRLRVERDDGSVEEVELETRGFLRHDLAHYAVEAELGLTGGFWGWVASGGSLDGVGIDTSEIMLAESLAGPVQTLMRTDGTPAAYLGVLRAQAPARADEVTANAIHERVRRLRGHWTATPYSGVMALSWPPEP